MKLETTPAHCPNCGEPITLVIDCSLSQQRYIEDCEVCCAPMMVEVSVDLEHDLLSCEVSAEL